MTGKKYEDLRYKESSRAVKGANGPSEYSLRAAPPKRSDCV